MATPFLIGRLIVGSYFIVSGLNHFMSRATLVQSVAAKGVPSPDVAIAITGLLVMFGGVSILLGWRAEWGITAIVVFLVGVSFPMHNFWAEAGIERAHDFVNFSKNMALIGAALMLVAVPRPWPYSVERPARVRV